MENLDLNKIFEKFPARAEMSITREKEQVICANGEFSVGYDYFSILLKLKDSGNNQTHIVIPYQLSKHLAVTLSEIVKHYENFTGREIQSPDKFNQTFSQFIKDSEKQQNKPAEEVTKRD